MATLAPNKFDWSELPFLLFTGSIYLSFAGVIIYVIYAIFFG